MCCGTEDKTCSVLIVVMVAADVVVGAQRGMIAPTRQADVDEKAWVCHWWKVPKQSKFCFEAISKLQRSRSSQLATRKSFSVIF